MEPNSQEVQGIVLVLTAAAAPEALATLVPDVLSHVIHIIIVQRERTEVVTTGGRRGRVAGAGDAAVNGTPTAGNCKQVDTVGATGTRTAAEWI